MHMLRGMCRLTVFQFVCLWITLSRVDFTQCKSLFSSDDQIVIANRGLTVPSGRSVYLTPAHLQLRVNSSDRCVITVLDNDPLAHRPGRLTPLSFPCSFRPQEVAYTHFGAPNSHSDAIRLQLRYDYFHETVIVPFSIHVTVSTTPLEVVTRNLALRVEKPLGVSNPVSSNTTVFAYSRGAELCKVSLRPLISGQPKHGEVVGDGSMLEMMDCDEFLNYGLRYRHTTQGNSPNKDYLPFVVHILDAGGKVTKTEYFHVPVIISQGKENEKPVLESSSKLTLEVDQLLMTAVRTETLSALDSETPSDFLVFSFVKPVTSGEGYFVNTDDRNRKVSSFYQRDVRELKIAYVPHSSHGPTLSRTFYVDMQVSDADGATSAPFKLKIVVRPFSPQVPRVVTNRGLQLFEGQSKIIHAESNLHIAGGPALDKAQIYIVDGLRHGRLTIPENRKYFTVADLRAGSVAYQHDDSDSFSDNTVFKITDGSKSVEFLFPIWIFPEDDEPPIVNVNTGLEIGKSNMAKISSLVLSATDSDSDVTQLRYVLETPLSEEGAIVRRQVQMPDSPEDWELVGGVFEQVVEEFTHGDVLNGLVFYKHTGPHRSEQITDTVRFHVVDSGDPPNRSGVKELVVMIEPVDDDPPYLFYETSLSMDVVNFQVTEIKKKFLRYTDDDTEDRDIRFNITSPPADTDENAAISAGSIVHCEKPNKGITSFTQGQINQKEICYKPPKEDSGLTARIVQFVFDVEDASGNFLKDQRFSIFIQPVMSPPPLIKNAVISVSEGGTVKLTTNMLDAEEPNSNEDDIEFIILGPPRHGHIKMKSKVLERGASFVRKNIRDGDIEYANDSEHIGDDLIVLDVTDGVHHIPVRVRVHVRNTDDERPAMVSGSADVLKLKMQVHESKSSPLPLESLRNSDADGRSTKLVMERAPYDGFIRRGESQTTEFTLADAMAGSITYQHTGGEVGLTGRGDYFQFTVTNPKKSLIVDGRKIFKILVEVEILPVDNQPPIVSVGSPFEVSESKKAPLLPRHVDATDADTEDVEILCLVMSQPKLGYLENTAPQLGSEKPQTGVPISSFTVGEIRQGAINYAQSVHKGSEPRNDTMTFRCSDGTNHSPEFRFDIRIVPHNDEKPEIALREFTVVEGSNMRIDSQILKVTDGDVPHDKIAFLITAQPRHGKIVRQTREGSFKIQSFTVEDISGESTIAYEHDDSETLVDSFTFDLTDGMHKISKTVPIKILPLDDEPPRLVVNNGLKIAAGESKKITNKVLRAEDPDSKLDISFHVRSKPKYGSLRYIQGSVAVQLTQGSSFTQKDIDKRKIEYVHTDKEGMRDIIRLDVSDGLNSLQDRYFYINVEGAESVSPKFFNRGLQLGKNGAVALTTELLSETDLSLSNSDVSFTVTRAPSRGQLEMLGRPGITITSFTLLQLAENKVRYTHIGGDDHRMDSFEFVEGKGQQSPSRYTFRVLVNDPGNRKPVVILQTLNVKIGDNKPLTPADIKVDDADTPASQIVFSVVQTPSRGVLLHNVSRVLSSFTMAEISDGLISYQHDGSGSQEDRFTFTVTDGAHPDFLVYPDMDATLNPQTMFISVRPDDSGVPQININKGASYLTRLAGGHLGFSITNRVLSVEDRDVPEDHLFYTVSAPPKWGYIINRAIGNRTIHSWTQGDINRHLIEYILLPGVNVTSDSFVFNISDKVGNVLVGQQTFHLNWAWLSLDNDTYLVNETDILNVTIRRRGYLGEMASVSIHIINGTARSGEDFSTSYVRLVQFSPGQTEKIWKLRPLDDTVFERVESFELRLADPVSAVLDQPDTAQVTIQDFEDESHIFFTDRVLRTSEKIGDILIPIKRVGDSSEEITVICSTVSGTAVGTFPVTLTSSDFVPRPTDHTSVITIHRGEKEGHCRVTIIDDDLNEEEEKFSVQLTEPSGGQLGKISSVDIYIEPDQEDVPIFYFANSEFNVDESDQFVEIPVVRTGSDLSKTSNVTVRSKKNDPKTADAGQDYIAMNNVLEFGPGETTRTVRVTILDDASKPRLEGPESFLVQLRSPMNGHLGEPQTAVVTITDVESDLPSVQFKEARYNFRESNGKVEVVIYRTGDVNHESAVLCHSKAGTAKPGADYVDKPATEESLIVFSAGEHDKMCAVTLVDDALYEENKHFSLHLTPTVVNKLYSVKIGQQGSTTVTIQDEDDHPVIKLSDTKYVVREPMFKEEISRLHIPVIRLGDLSQTIIVTLDTADDTALAGSDYTPIFTELVFGSNESKKTVEVEILYDGVRETRETFTVQLRSRSGIVRIENAAATIHIEERNRVADISFPDIPIVMSLRDFDRPEAVDDKPIQGYPLICVTPCNPKHPSHQNSIPLCDSQNINDSLTLYRWRASSLTKSGDVTKEMYDIESNTFFTSTKSITLDSIYFAGGSRVQCVVRAVNTAGDPGQEQESEIKTINPESGVCEPRAMDSITAEPFTARIQYTGPAHPTHPKKIKISVTIPHRDGMFPVLTTQSVTDFDSALKKPGAYILNNNLCTSLLNIDPVSLKMQPLVDESHIKSEIFPYQLSTKLRSEPTIQFYKNLNLKTCIWNYEKYLDLEELISKCGGQLTVDSQLPYNVQSYMYVNIPLYVSYIFHSPAMEKNWLNIDLTSKLHFAFTYDTATLWEKGINSSEVKSGLEGSVYPKSLIILDDGRLSVTFDTSVKFHGNFLAESHDTGFESSVKSLDHPYATFQLKLKESARESLAARQTWNFISDDTDIKDYSGTYIIRLVPCLVNADPKFNQPDSCSPQMPLTFHLPIRIQQVSDFVPPQYSGSTHFYLTRSKELWMSENRLDLTTDSDVAFANTDKIYGRVAVDLVQNLANSYNLSIEKVLLCSGKDGYIPKFDPHIEEYGCFPGNTNLQHSLKILDKNSPASSDVKFQNVDFSAALAFNDSAYSIRQFGDDGFSLNALPLYQGDYKSQWYLQVVYSIKSRSSGRGTWLYNTFGADSDAADRQRQVGDEPHGIGIEGRGTNIIHVRLDYLNLQAGDAHLDASVTSDSDIPWLPIIISAVAIVLIFIILMVALFIRQRRKSSPPSSPNSTITIIKNGHTKVIVTPQHYQKRNVDV